MAAPLLKQAEVSIEVADREIDNLVVDWEDLLELDNIEIVAQKTEPEDLTAVEMANSPQAKLNQWYADNAARQAAWVEEQQKNSCKITRKLTRKTWKSINKCKGNFETIDFIKMVFRAGMICRWKKQYKKHFPTYHAVGKKWQGQVDGFVDDYIRTLKAQKEYDGGYEVDFWMDAIIPVTQRILPRLLKRAHKHTPVVLESMIKESAKLDWGLEGLHGGLSFKI